jgi:hypothetical protein
MQKFKPNPCQPHINPMSTVTRTIKKIIKKLTKIRLRENWAIGIYTGDSPLNLRSPAHLKNPVLTAADVTDVPADFVADPFMYFANGCWHLFFEVLNVARNKGEIGLATSPDGFTWQYQQIILREPFHLSYPYIFQAEHEFFMLPETFEDRSVRLYKATNFPHKWELVNILLKDKDYVDASIVHFQNYWWLFSTTQASDALHLHFSPHLTEGWTEHPQSPVIKDNKQIARPGGRVVLHGQQLIRYTQDDRTVYGREVAAFMITELTPECYREEAAPTNPIVQASGSGWNAVGMHNLDPHPLDEKQWIACVDGYYKSYVFGRGQSMPEIPYIKFKL